MKNNAAKKKLAYTLLAAAVGIMFYLYSSKPQAPFVPEDNIHNKLTTNAECMQCHAPGKRELLQEGHTRKDECFTCHKIKLEITGD